MIDDSAKFCKHCGATLSNDSNVPPLPPREPMQPSYMPQQPIYNAPVAAPSNDEVLIRRLADYERLSCIFWLILGIIQVICVFTIIAGIWNIVAVISRWKLPRKIRQRDPSIIEEYRGIGGLIIIGLINFFFGAIIGVAFVVFDLYVRDKVLSNAHLFNVNYAKA
jgi:hypothetical protein